MRLIAPLVVAALACICAGLVSCSSPSGDPPFAGGVPPAGGKDKRIHDIADPTLPDHASLIDTTQAVSGAIVIAVDQYDETNDGKSIGDIYVEDLGATVDTPYAGINLFSPTFNPGNLKVSPGDVLDMKGTYEETAVITSKPPIVFPEGSVLVQLSKPTATFRYETKLPEPVDIDVNDLNDFEKGRRWVGMLVRVSNVTMVKAPFASNGRVSVDLATSDAPFVFCGPKPVPTLVNSFYPIDKANLTAGQVVKSITGVVLFFCNLQLAPRSADDIQL